MDPVNPSRRTALKTLLGLLALPAFYTEAQADTHLPRPPSDQNVLFLQRTDADFLSRRQIFNKRITLMPRLIAVCYNEKGAQTAVRYANQTNLAVSVKSGGHCFEGYSLNEGGLLIDLSLFNKLSYLAASKTLVARPGAKLGKVYEYLAPHKRLIPAGSCAGVGVAGLVLGGGYGFFSRQYGLTCDSLKRVQMVDGKGNLLDSNDNPDLLWACRGGNNGSLGIVTRFEFDTHPTPSLFHSYRFKYKNLNLAQATELAKRWFELMPSLPHTAYSSWVLNRNQLSILITDTATPSKLSSITQVLSKGATEIMPVRHDAFLAGIKRYRGGQEPMYFKNVSAGYYQSFKSIEPVFADIFKAMQASLLKQNLLQINTMGGAINNSRKAAASAYPHRNFAFLGEFQVYYDKASQGNAAVDLVNQVQKKLTSAGIKAHYGNYPDINLPNWQEAYYGDAYLRLQKLKHQLDPENRIRHPQSVQL